MARILQTMMAKVSQTQGRLSYTHICIHKTEIYLIKSGLAIKHRQQSRLSCTLAHHEHFIKIANNHRQLLNSHNKVKQRLRNTTHLSVKPPRDKTTFVEFWCNLTYAAQTLPFYFSSTYTGTVCVVLSMLSTYNLLTYYATLKFKGRREICYFYDYLCHRILALDKKQLK